ncbi:MAG TPA: hypothetical protein VLT51_13675 [Anaerolineales bacterium]|nr:hypothetical protein [Anaerolineales bacterium]
MLIDQFSPGHDVSARYQIDIHAPIAKAYSAARHLDMSESWIVRWLYRLRGLPTSSLTLDGMLKWGFVLLADNHAQELVFGLIGRFWTPSAQIQSITADTFVDFHQPGYAKVVGNIAFFPRDSGIVQVTTETRVHCLDYVSRRNFRLYWLLIGPFSGMIRKEWLRLIKQEAEESENSGRAISDRSSRM